MAEFMLGKRERITWVDETSYGSGGDMGVDGEVVGLNATLEPDFNQNWQEILTAGSDTRTVEDRVLGPLSLPFTLNFTAKDWKFLKYVGYDVTDAGSSPYTHTFSLSDTVNSFKLEWALRHTTPVVVTLSGCFVQSATISFSKATGEGGEGDVSVSLNCMASGYSLGSTVSSVSATTRNPYQWRHVKFTFNNSEYVEVNSGELSIDQGINPEDSRYCNATQDRELSEPIPTVHRVEGNININMKDNTFTSQWDGEAVVSNCSLDFIRDSANNKLEASFSNFRIGPGPFPSTNLEGVDNADVSFTAESFSSLIATDDQSTY